MPRTSRAFTLVELAAVSLILALTAAIAAPGFAGIIARAQLRRAAETLSNDLASARRTAIQRGHPITVCPSRNGMHCQPGDAWQAGWLILDGTRILSEHEPLPRDLRVSAPPARGRVTFSGSGMAGSANTTIVLCLRKRPETAMAVVVSMVGRIRRAAPDSARAAACAASSEDNR